MPTFPEISPEITCDRALNMILASIAMEELALSHIMNAEGEKLQYVLGTLKETENKDPSIEEVLAVNQSITCLLESVSENQMILKNKMDKALHALSDVCPGPGRIGPTGPTGPTGPQGEKGPTGPTGSDCKCTCRCSAVFKGPKNGEIWRAGCTLPWNIEHLHGRCVRYDPCDKTKIELCSKGRFIVSFAVNARAKLGCKCDVAVSLQMLNTHRHSDIYTVHNHIPYADTTFTISMSGIIVEVPDNHDSSSLILKLVSSDSLDIENSTFTIVEI